MTGIDSYSNQGEIIEKTPISRTDLSINPLELATKLRETKYNSPLEQIMANHLAKTITRYNDQLTPKELSEITNEAYNLLEADPSLQRMDIASYLYLKDSILCESLKPDEAAEYHECLINALPTTPEITIGEEVKIKEKGLILPQKQYNSHSSNILSG